MRKQKTEDLIMTKAIKEAIEILKHPDKYNNAYLDIIHGVAEAYGVIDNSIIRVYCGGSIHADCNIYGVYQDNQSNNLLDIGYLSSGTDIATYNRAEESRCPTNLECIIRMIQRRRNKFIAMWKQMVQELPPELRPY